MVRTMASQQSSNVYADLPDQLAPICRRLACSAIRHIDWERALRDAMTNSEPLTLVSELKETAPDGFPTNDTVVKVLRFAAQSIEQAVDRIMTEHMHKEEHNASDGS